MQFNYNFWRNFRNNCYATLVFRLFWKEQISQASNLGREEKGEGRKGKWWERDISRYFYHGHWPVNMNNQHHTKIKRRKCEKPWYRKESIDIIYKNSKNEFMSNTFLKHQQECIWYLLQYCKYGWPDIKNRSKVTELIYIFKCKILEFYLLSIIWHRRKGGPDSMCLEHIN